MLKSVWKEEDWNTSLFGGKEVTCFHEKATEPHWLGFSCQLPSPHMTKTELTTKTKSSTTQNLKQVTQVLFTSYKNNQLWKLKYFSAEAKKKKEYQLTWFHNARCEIQEKNHKWKPCHLKRNYSLISISFWKAMIIEWTAFLHFSTYKLTHPREILQTGLNIICFGI